MMVSLVISTRNRASRLPELFAWLARLESPDAGWELILVDNGSTDGTAAAIREFATAAPCAVRCVHAATPGLSHARNAGLGCAAGRIVAFTDDDCYPQPDYLRAIVDVFERHRPGVLGGRVVLHDSADARVGVKDVLSAFEIAPRTFVRPGVMHGANLAVRREVLAAIGGFDPLLGAGTRCMAGEDTDFIARIVWAGWTAATIPRRPSRITTGASPEPQRTCSGRATIAAAAPTMPSGRSTHGRGVRISASGIAARAAC